MATPEQIAHIKSHHDLFDELHGGLRGRDVEGYFREFAHIPDLYELVCSDLGLAPLAPTAQGPGNTPLAITFVPWDPDTDQAQVKHDGVVVWADHVSSIGQYFRHFPPPTEPVVLSVEWF